MLAEIISIGDELLIGQTINTNAAWMGQELNKIGIDVHQTSVITDNKRHIINTLDDVRKRVDLVLITGGLGPTNDDITKYTLAEYFHSELHEDSKVLAGVKKRLKARNLEMNELNRQQAIIPDKATIFLNRWGTAPGMWFEDHGQVFVSMPGVPTEMKGLMTTSVLPAIKEKFQPPEIVHRTLLTIGLIEAKLAELLVEFEAQLPPEIKMAYLPSTPIIKLRLSARGEDRNHLITLLNEQEYNLQQIIPDYIFGKEPETLQEIVGRLLKGKKATLSTAESCTGGNIARLITSIPGCSDYYEGSSISYAYSAKIKTLGVDPYTLEKQGAVSKEVVLQMAIGAQQLFNTDYAIAVSGIAGPGGATPDKPVGTTWIAIATPKGAVAHPFLFGTDRNGNIHRASLTALNLLRIALQ